LDQILRKSDPDVVLTQWGDSFIIPQLLRLSRLVGKRIAFHRDPQPLGKSRRESSYFSYGKIIYQPATHQFFGRWHIDSQNCFLWQESQWEGLFEVARITKLPVQQIARASIGSGITSMQMERAHRENILIPWRKRKPENFKSAADLINSDKGGLVYQPVVGFHENVAEIDFASMYPALMVSYNISPETIGCTCCSHNRIPEIHYTVCTRREGLVPKTLRPLLDKRAQYKRLQQAASTSEDTLKFQARQKALKWLLVVCFGYLGYKNARFGRIEAHEAVTALSREVLLQAKEIAEAEGFSMLHAVVDCIWVRKPGATVEEYQGLSDRIATSTRIPTVLEGVYRWLHFLPSRTNSRLGVPNRYVGAFQDGSLKVRGLTLRRHDTPRFIRRAQEKMLRILSAACNLQEYRNRLPQAQSIFRETLEKLRAGLLPIEDMVITRRLSQDPAEYQKASLIAIAAGELAKGGVLLRAGETIQYIVTDARARDLNSRARAYASITSDWSYDVAYYEEQLRRASKELLDVP
ncbi:MAG: DNA polymerase domain-containing protein, partial [Candidatus Binatia bacterium]|nr:DNA polymerase domain-containing protein [Candidatus Binatia bacterium]